MEAFDAVLVLVGFGPAMLLFFLPVIFSDWQKHRQKMKQLEVEKLHLEAEKRRSNE